VVEEQGGDPDAEPQQGDSRQQPPILRHSRGTLTGLLMRTL
jgi:hypothetical protein